MNFDMFDGNMGSLPGMMYTDLGRRGYRADSCAIGCGAPP